MNAGVVNPLQEEGEQSRRGLLAFESGRRDLTGWHEPKASADDEGARASASERRSLAVDRDEFNPRPPEAHRASN
jgi:hypothetical protein